MVGKGSSGRGGSAGELGQNDRFVTDKYGTAKEQEATVIDDKMLKVIRTELC